MGVLELVGVELSAELRERLRRAGLICRCRLGGDDAWQFVAVGGTALVAFCSACDGTALPLVSSTCEGEPLGFECSAALWGAGARCRCAVPAAANETVPSRSAGAMYALGWEAGDQESPPVFCRSCRTVATWTPQERAATPAADESCASCDEEEGGDCAHPLERLRFGTELASGDVECDACGSRWADREAWTIAMVALRAAALEMRADLDGLSTRLEGGR
jgi:hypothetical protein